MSDHTPTPWELSEPEGPHGSRLLGCCLNDAAYGFSIAEVNSGEFTDDDAEFILRAVNSHDALLARAEAAEQERDIAIAEVAAQGRLRGYAEAREAKLREAVRDLLSEYVRENGSISGVQNSPWIIAEPKWQRLMALALTPTPEKGTK